MSVTSTALNELDYGPWVAGRPWAESGTVKENTLISPSTGQVIGRLRHADDAAIDAALQAAQDTASVWAATTVTERAALLLRAAAGMRDRSGELVDCLTQEQGKTRVDAQGEVAVVIDTFEWFAGEVRGIGGREIPARTPTGRWQVTEQPIGPVAAFSPWNYPLLTAARKVVPALAAGCPIIIKPDEQTAGAAFLMAQVLHDAGLPEGVLSMLVGDPAHISSRLIASPVIRKISFTGSVPVGRHLAELAAKHLKPSTMELGGHAPVIICADADPVAAAQAAVSAKFRNSGQVCTSPTRFYVHRTIYEPFSKAFAEAAQALKLGVDGQLGPLVNERRLDAVASLVDDAVAQGARILTGGARADGPGWFYLPTILADVPAQARILTEEPFGPVAALMPFDDVDDALARANALPYGLAAYVFTHDPALRLKLSRGMESGMVGINTFTISAPETPFSGVKDSGWGYEGGREGLSAYLISKFVSEDV